VVQQEPNDLETHYRMGVCFFKLGCQRKGIKSFDRVLKMCPSYFSKSFDQNEGADEIRQYRNLRPENFPFVDSGCGFQGTKKSSKQYSDVGNTEAKKDTGPGPDGV
jgi:hypothetical protein